MWSLSSSLFDKKDLFRCKQEILRLQRSPNFNTDINCLFKCQHWYAEMLKLSLRDLLKLIEQSGCGLSVLQKQLADDLDFLEKYFLFETNIKDASCLPENWILDSLNFQIALYGTIANLIEKLHSAGLIVSLQNDLMEQLKNFGDGILAQQTFYDKTEVQRVNCPFT